MSEEYTEGRSGMGVHAACCTVVALVVFMIMAISITAIVVDGYRDCQYIKAGYTRKTLPGCCYPKWVKESPDDRNKAAPVPGLDPRNWIVSEPVPLSNAAGGGR